MYDEINITNDKIKNIQEPLWHQLMSKRKTPKEDDERIVRIESSRILIGRWGGNERKRWTLGNEKIKPKKEEHTDYA